MIIESSQETYRRDIALERVLVALRPIDVVQQKLCRVDVQLTANQQIVASFRNPSGYYCLFDLPAGANTLVAQPLGRYRNVYLAQPFTVQVPFANPGLPVMDIEMLPARSYPFDPSATPVRGRVVTPTGEAIAGVAIHVQARPHAKTISDSDGWFVLDTKPVGDETAFLIFTNSGLPASRVVQLSETHPTSMGDVVLN